MPNAPSSLGTRNKIALASRLAGCAERTIHAAGEVSRDQPSLEGASAHPTEGQEIYHLEKLLCGWRVAINVRDISRTLPEDNLQTTLRSYSVVIYTAPRGSLEATPRWTVT